MNLKITDIRSCWEEVKPGLLAIAQKCAAEWRVEDVYARCLAGEWTLFMGPEVDGFLILSQYSDRYRNEKRLVVECAYHDGALDPFATYEPFLFATARQIGAVCIEFTSPRRGFEKKGWSVTDITYRKEV
jgi:hypothetical protein